MNSTQVNVRQSTSGSKVAVHVKLTGIWVVNEEETLKIHRNIMHLRMLKYQRMGGDALDSCESLCTSTSEMRQLRRVCVVTTGLLDTLMIQIRCKNRMHRSNNMF